MDKSNSIHSRFALAGILLSTSVLSSSVLANSKQDERVLKLSQQPSTLVAGQALFEQICASCHSKDLSGASGFNLKDGEWIHGGKPSQVVSNIQNGFMNAGMPGFGQIFSEEQIESIAAYVLSKREGWEDLHYKIYQFNGASDNTISESKLVKQGKSSNNFADFVMPEMKHYALVLEGDFHTYKDQITKLWTGRPKELDIELEIDGEPVPRSYEWNPTWVLKKGTQHLKMTFKVHDLKYWKRNIPLIVTNEDLSIKLFAASLEGRKVMSGKKLELKSQGEIVVHRKKVHSIPAYSISVGLPQKLNYAFNTRTCSIVGLWHGDMLDVGPNVSGRGQDGSLPLGKWVFHQPQSLSVQNEQKCKYKGYQFDQEPKFKFKLNGKDFTLTANALNPTTLSFNYQTSDSKPLRFSLPNADSVTWSSDKGTVKNGQLIVTPDVQGQFSIIANVKK